MYYNEHDITHTVNLTLIREMEEAWFRYRGEQNKTAHLEKPNPKDMI